MYCIGSFFPHKLFLTVCTWWSRISEEEERAAIFHKVTIMGELSQEGTVYKKQKSGRMYFIYHVDIQAVGGKLINSVVIKLEN
jgi:hypothetical protein